MTKMTKMKLVLSRAPLLAATVTTLGISYQSCFADTAETKRSPRKSESRAVESRASSKNTLLESMLARYRGVKALSADFSQKQMNLALGTTKETSGQIQIKRPNMFRWETTEPVKEASSLVGNGKKVWFYKPPFREGERGQVLIRDAADVQSQLAIDLLSGQGDFRKQFKYKQLAADKYELIPLKPAGDIERIELYIERPTKLVYKLSLFTVTGNQTDLQLKNVDLGAKLKDSTFHFVPPAKTEEIY